MNLVATAGPLTLTLSPEGRGDAVGAAGEGAEAVAGAEPFASPLRGEADAQRRVRGPSIGKMLVFWTGQTS
jgi:hypothetical protein